MRLQRGLVGWAYLVGFLAVMGGVYAIYAYIDNTWETKAGFRAGEASKQAEWDTANKKAQEAQDRTAKASAAVVAEEAKKLAEANHLANTYYDLWMKERQDARNKGTPLANAVCPPQPANGGKKFTETPGTAGPPSIRFTWQFVGLWDSAWTGEAGKPLFGNSAAIAPAGSGSSASSPYGPDEVLDNHKTNAERHSACYRELNSLITTVERLRKKWDESNM